METWLWTSDVRLLPAGLALVVGLWLTTAGTVRQVRALRMPVEAPGKNWTWVRGMRNFLAGLSLLAIGAGWALQLPVMIAAGLVVGFEETIETSIAAWALRQEAEGRQGFA